MPLTDALLSTSDGMAMQLVDISRANLTGGTGNNFLDASAFSGQVTLSGDTGNDTLWGGSGNDLLNGEGGNDILVGNGGNDNLLGGAGRDLLLGGLGTDALDGGTDDDIVIGETTAHDGNQAAQDAILAQWTTTSVNYATRIANLAALLNSSTVFSDGEVDTLTRGKGLDWFFAAYLSDLLTDLHRGGTETVTYL
jgi:Ca2+-binding RTX toxin-like protein